MATRSGSGEGLDVKDVLAGLAPPRADDEVSAGFFHRTLARWLGLPEGRQPGRKKTAPVLWDYDFWKAELHADGDGAYTAKLYRKPEGDPEVVRYWIKLDAGGRIRQSGWLTTAPVLVDEGPRNFGPARTVDDTQMAALYSTDD